MVTKHVVVLPYDEQWKQDFLKIKAELADALGQLVKTQSPPDYVNHKKKYMMEVMRFDDYEQNGFSQNEVESRRTKEMMDRFRQTFGHNPDPEYDKFIPNFYLDSRSVNGRELYYKNFYYVVEKHSLKIPVYKQNYTGYKLAFLLCDESPTYVETKEKLPKKPKNGDFTGPCRYYEPPYDPKFIGQLKKLDVDYVIWATPYKEMIPDGMLGLNTIYLIDIQKMKKKSRHIDYDYEKVYCLEDDEEDKNA
ncbi:MAG: hypothetical protein IJI66_10195 [Erysipelotrichaceae bacterium]|nr:hypothetical protein [Erysipelotrichaceae bacterium]